MRDTRKTDEDRAIQAVSHALKNRGSTVGDDTRTVQDAPDWVFDLDGTGVAAECTCINLEQLMRWSNTTARLVPEKCYSITFPKEPHLWIKKAIEAKEPKIETYVQNSGAEEVWLIAHDSFDQGLALYECDPEMLDFMKRAASALDSDFSRIWFVHSEAGCHQLWRKGDEVVPFPELDLSSGPHIGRVVVPDGVLVLVSSRSGNLSGPRRCIQRSRCRGRTLGFRSKSRCALGQYR